MEKQFHANGRILMLIVLILVNSTMLAVPGFAADNDNQTVNIYFFWGEGCPHCADEKPFLDHLEVKYPELKVESYEVWYDQENAKLFSEMAEAFGTTAQYVPTTFIGDKYWVGYADHIAKEMEAKIKSCIDNGCTNLKDKLDGGDAK